MSSAKNLRKRPSRDSLKNSEGSPRKKIKTEELEDVQLQTKQPIIAPNGKIFYPCQYCSKVFPQKKTNITHMKKCPSKNFVLLETTNSNDEGNINNNNLDDAERVELNRSGSSTENKTPEPKIRISQNITVYAAQPEREPINDVSVYDYKEEDNPDDPDFKENSDDEAMNNRMCKHCKTIFENPLELLRHTRDCHNFPRMILPPDEIEKYFDSPNREHCPICNKPIKTRNFRSVFIKHLLVHTTGLTHECKVCKKKFRRRDHMKAHEKRHIVSV